VAGEDGVRNGRHRRICRCLDVSNVRGDETLEIELADCHRPVLVKTKDNTDDDPFGYQPKVKIITTAGNLTVPVPSHP
jgi:hypothetical protein